MEERFVTLAGIRVSREYIHRSRLRAPTRQRRSQVNTHVRCASAGSRASTPHARKSLPPLPLHFPLKIREAIGSSSCSIILLFSPSLLPYSSSLLFLRRFVAPCAFPTLKDVTSCNADQRRRERARERAGGQREATSATRGSPSADCNSIKA